MKNKMIQYYGAALLSMFFWSFSFVWFKIANRAYQPMTIILLRIIIAAILLFAFAKATRKLQRIKKADLKIIVMLAFFEPFMYFMGESYGLMYISSTVAAVIVATVPLITPFVAWYFYKEKLTRTNIFGLIISFIGVCMVVLTGSLHFAASPLGIGLEFIAVLSSVCFIVVLKRLTESYNTVTILFYQNLFGSLMFLPIWGILESAHVSETGFNTEALWAIVKLAIFASVIAFIFFTFAVKNIGVNHTNVFINLIPVFVAIIAFFILGDRLSLQNIIGIGITVTGLFLTQLKKRKRKNEKYLLHQT